MIAYMIRRILYAIPILLGVNLFTFLLFFFVNSPDQMARFHLGAKRVTLDQIETWKRERNYHLPSFYNDGWVRKTARELSETEWVDLSTLPKGLARLEIEWPAGTGTFRIHVAATPATAIQFDAPAPSPPVPTPEKTTHILTLSRPDSGASTVRIPFEVTAENGASIQVRLERPEKASGAVLRVEGFRDLGLLNRFTQTVFYQRSLKFFYFDFGKADDGRPIGDEILKRIPPSLSITLPMFVIGILAAISTSMVLAFFRGTYLDFWGVILCVGLMSVSVMFYVIGGQWVMGKILKVFPISGYEGGLDAWKFVILPVVIGVLGQLGSDVRWYRTIFLEEIGKDYVRTARSKGLPESVVLYKHSLKNAMIPILTGVVVSLPFLFIGSLVLESFFGIPGMGSFTIEAIQRQDFAIVQAMVFLGSVLYVVGLLLTDLSYTLVDPRVRLK